MKVLRSREDWVAAAIAGLARDGEAGLAVEALARDLKVTKGSFYWHFRDRTALLLALLEAFEATGADAPIQQLSKVADGRERLRLLFAQAFGRSLELRAERTLLGMRDPAVQRVVLRVHQKRRAFLEKTYRSLGFAPRQAKLWAATAYASFVGAVELASQAPWDTDERLQAWVEHLVVALIPEPASGKSRRAGSSARNGPGKDSS